MENFVIRIELELTMSEIDFASSRSHIIDRRCSNANNYLKKLYFIKTVR